MTNENETLRWPTNLDRAAIEDRLAKIRESVQSIPELASHFPNLEGMTPAQIGSSVIAALNWLQDKPEHRAITTQLEMVAMNLKNLK